MSHADALLACLKRGGWWSTAQILREHPMTVHSRVAQLRSQGHVIEHRTVGIGAPGSQYRLVASLSEGGTPAYSREDAGWAAPPSESETPLEPTEAPTPVSVDSSGSSVNPPPGSSEPVGPLEPQQLTLEAA